MTDRGSSLWTTPPSVTHKLCSRSRCPGREGRACSTRHGHAKPAASPPRHSVTARSPARARVAVLRSRGMLGTPWLVPFRKRHIAEDVPQALLRPPAPQATQHRPAQAVGAPAGHPALRHSRSPQRGPRQALVRAPRPPSTHCPRTPRAEPAPTAGPALI